MINRNKSETCIFISKSKFYEKRIFHLAFRMMFFWYWGASNHILDAWKEFKKRFYSILFAGNTIRIDIEFVLILAPNWNLSKCFSILLRKCHHKENRTVIHIDIKSISFFTVALGKWNQMHIKCCQKWVESRRRRERERKRIKKKAIFLIRLMYDRFMYWNMNFSNCIYGHTPLIFVCLSIFIWL